MATMITKHFAQTHAADGADALPDQSPGIWDEFAGPAWQQAPLLVSENWTNASGGDWSTASDWSNGATPTASTNATISLAGTYTVTITTADTAASLLINDSKATVADTGTLTLGGALSITAGTFALQSGGSLVGGTISTGSAGVFSAQGGLLDGATYRGTLSVGTSQSLYVAGGLTLQGANSTGAGHIALASGALLEVQDTETLDNATLTLAGSGATLDGGESGYYTPPSTLTLGSGFTILQSGSGQNYLTAGYYYSSGIGYVGDTIVNNGTIAVTGGTLTATGNDDNGIFTNAGIIKVSAGEFQIYYDGFTNTGSIAISGTGALDVYQSSLTFSAGGSVTTTGSGVIIDDYGGTLLGTISGATSIDFAGGSLAGVTYQGTLSVGVSQAVYVSGGLTLEGAGGTGAGAVSLADGALLDVQDTETLDNATLTLAGSSATLEVGGDNASPATVTLGSGFTVLQSGSGQNYLTDGYYRNYPNYIGDSITNNGTIAVTGGTLTATGDDDNGLFTNAGIIKVSAGEFQLYYEGFTNTGSVAISGTGALDVYQSSLTFSAGGSVTTTGSGVIIDDYGGTLLGTISGATSIDFAGGSLAGVTYQGTLSVGVSQAVYVSGGLTLEGAGGTGAGAVSLADGALLDVQDTETLDNATLTLAGSSATLEVGGDNASPATVTLGSGFTVLQSGSGQNYLTDGYYRNYPNYIGDSITNNGTIAVTGGTLTATGDDDNGLFTNAGIIKVSAGEFQLYYEGFTNTGSVAISGTGALDVYQSSLTFGAGGSITTSGGGTVIDDDGGTLLGTISSATNVDFAGGSLAGVTWQGPFLLGANQSVAVSNGLTLTGSGSLALGSSAAMYLTGGLAGVTSLSLADGALLDVQDTETLDNGTLTLAGSGATLEIGGNNTSPAAVTLGSGFTVLQSGSGQNYLTDGYYRNYPNYIGDSITNNGTIAVTGGTLTATGDDDNGIFTNAGIIKVSAGEFQIYYDAFTNTGSVAISGTGALDVLNSSLTLGAGGSITTSGSGVIIDDSGGTLLGTISGATSIDFAGGSLAGVTYQGTLSVGVSQAVYVSGGLTLEGAGGTGAGAVSLADGALLDVQDTETLDNATLTLAGSSATLEVGGDNASPATVTLGSGFTVLQSGSGQNYLTDGYYRNYPNYIGDSITNNGTIAVTGGTLTATGDDDNGLFTNAGIIKVSAGEFQLYYEGFTNTGSVAISGTGALDVYQSSLTFGAGGSITTSGGGTVIDDDGGTLLGTISSATNVDFAGGSLAGVTWQGPFLLGANQSVAVSNGLTLTGSGSLALGSSAAMYLTGGLAGVTSLSLADGALLDVQDTETLDNGTLTLAGSGATLEIGGNNTSPAAVTLGSGFTVLQSSSSQNYLTAGYYRNYPNYIGDSITNNGTIAVTGGTLTVNSTDGNGTFTNTGLINVAGAGTFDMTSIGTLTNVSGSTLTGGIFEAGAGASLLLVENVSIVTDASTLILSGAGSAIESYNSTTGTYATLDRTLHTVASTGALKLLAGRNFSASAAFTDNGLLQLGGGIFTASAGLNLASTGTLTGFGTIKANVANAGLVLASVGTLTLAGSVSGAGAFGAAAGATLDLTTAETLTQSFTGAGTIKLDGGAYSLPAGAAISAGTIAVGSGASLSGFGTLTGALLDNGAVNVTSGTLLIDGATTGSGTLQISSGATLDLAGGGSFAGAIYGNGGSLYIDGAAPFVLQAGASLGNENIVVDAGATLDLTQGGNLNGDIVGAGTLQLDGATAYNFNPANGFDPAVGTLLVDTGASLNASGTIAGNLEVLGSLSVTTGTLVVGDALTGSGSVSIGAGALLDLAGFNATGTDVLPTLISGAGTLQLSTASSFTGGTLAVGTLIVGASLAASGTITGAVTVNGTLEATGMLAITGGLSGSGTLQADAGAVLDIAGGGTIAGSVTGAGTLQLDTGTYTLDGGSDSVATILVDAGATLAASGGTVLVQGALTGAGAVQIAGGAVLDLAGGGALNGAISGAGTLQIDGPAPLVLASGSSLGVSATVIDAGATLDLHANEILPATISGAGTLALDGAFTLGASKPAIATLQINAGASLTGVGTLASVIDNGTLATARGTLALTSGLAGNGALSLATGSVLDLRAGGSFAGTSSGTGTLQIDGATPLALTGASLHTVVSVHGGSTLSGFGTLVGAISDAGAITASGGKLILAGAVSGAGALAASAGATLALSGGGTLAQSISGAGTLQLSGAYTLGVHTPATAAVILSAGASLSGAGRLVGSLTDNGTLLANGGTLALARGVSGLGTLSVSAGSTLSLGAASSFSGLVTGAGEVDINANLSLSGAASLSAADVLLSANLVQASGDSLNILAGNSLTLSAAAGHIVTVQGAANDRLSNAGTLAAAGAGSAKMSEAFVNAGLVTSNAATLSFLGAATNNGSITAASGLTSFSALIGGTGTDQIGAAGTLSLLAGASAGQTIDFLASTGALDLTKPATFLGTINGFGGSDAIDLVNTKETSFGFSNGMLTVMNGKATVATLNFAGSYTTSDFTLGSDGHGGTAVAFV